MQYWLVATEPHLRLRHIYKATQGVSFDGDSLCSERKKSYSSRTLLSHKRLRRSTDTWLVY